MALQHLRLNVRLGPERLEELIVGHQPPGVFDEIPQHPKGLGGQKNALFRRAVSAPEALVDGVEPERRELPHGSTNCGEERFRGDEIGRSETLAEAAVDRCQDLARLVRSTLSAPEPSKAHRAPQLQGESALTSRHLE